MVSNPLAHCWYCIFVWLPAVPTRRIYKRIFTDSGVIDRSVGADSEHTATEDNQTASTSLTLNYELQRIAYCESGKKQFNSDGTVLHGRINPQDIGMFQINEKYWLAKSQELGYNIYTEKGNIEMAKWIYENYGNEPWRWSRNCWSGN